MNPIDFTPAWYTKEQVHKARRRKLATCFVLLVTGMGGWFAFARVQIGNAEHELADLRAELDEWNVKVRRAADVRADCMRVNARRDLYANLAGGVPMHGLVAEVSRVLPSLVVLSNLQITLEDRLSPDIGNQPADSRGPGASNLVMKGYAQSDVGVGQSVSRLAGSDAFRRVQLRYSRPRIVDGHPVTEFEVTGYVPKFE